MNIGIFLNYTWKPENLEKSCENAEKRFRDVFVGIDVFGRGCLGGGGFNCNMAFDEIAKTNLSLALFGTGWTYECHNENDFILNNEIFWSLLKPYLTKRKITQLPITTSFTHGCGREFFVAGKKYSNENGWINLSLQSSCLPVVSFDSLACDWCFQDAFYAGNSLQIKAGKSFTLYDLDVNIPANKTLNVEYVFKDDADNSTSNKFDLKISYILQNELKTQLLNQVLSDDFEFVKSYENLYSTNWCKKTFNFSPKTNIKLVSVCAINDYEETSKNSIKIGFLRISECENFINNSLAKIRSNDVKYKNELFCMQSQVYLCLKLNWNELTGDSSNREKYYNIFLDTNRNLLNSKEPQLSPNDAKFNFQYVGSTRNENFSMCLKLSSRLKLDPTLSSSNQVLSFILVVQEMDESLASLDEVNRIKSIDDLKSFQTIKMAFIEESRIKVEGNDLNFFEKIIFDFERFDE
jgi:hypothetical protein